MHCTQHIMVTEWEETGGVNREREREKGKYNERSSLRNRRLYPHLFPRVLGQIHVGKMWKKGPHLGLPQYWACLAHSPQDGLLTEPRRI